MSDALRRCEQFGFESGLAVGLARALTDVDVAAEAPGAYAAVPAWVPAAGQTVLRHCLADPENIAFVACPGPRPQGTPVQAEIGRHLGAVRIGLLRRALDLVVEGLAERSAGGEALLKKQLVLGDIAGVLAGAELARSLAWSRPDPGAVADLHRGLDELGWQVAKLAGAAGYLHDHPVRVLYAAALVANTWVGRVPALEPVP